MANFKPFKCSVFFNFMPQLIKKTYHAGTMWFYRFVCAIGVQAQISLMTRLHDIFRTLVFLVPEAYSKTCQTYTMMRHIDKPDIVISLFMHFLAYAGRFNNIHPWSIILRDIKDIINPYNCLLKNANFWIKTSNK